MIDWNDKTWINYVDGKVWENLPASSLKSRNNTEITFRCPICGDSKKNKLKKRGYFYRRTGSFHCFNCEANMTGYDFLKAICPPDVFDRIIQDYKVLNFNSIVKKSRQQNLPNQPFSQDFEILSPSPSYKYLLDAKWTTIPLTDQAKAYIDTRKIPLDKRSMLRTMLDSNGREFILIQWIFDDKCIYHQLHNYLKHDIRGQGPVKYVFPKDENINMQPKPVFNMDGVDPSFPYVFCTEGVYDSLFIKNGVALGGKVLTEYQHKMLKSCFPRHKIVLAFDNDDAGIQAMLKHIDKCPDVGFLNMYDILSTGHFKDVNEFVQATGRDDVFSNPKLLKGLVMSGFMMKMKLQLK
jgi:hypothetical protein